ncbi:Peptidoglycan/xylan/chitin deacetylase, PgdA/CDA1 family [Neorhodopirellula lusitana]|uniref:Peptidoglycan/xylan/chitin deacetylase, PgdA/CDA1 family n=1 Tax=Neorhodopirellula lusitana TaxID=445327 RepID=A0ABY1PRX4_9BACT|nr:polysaccharide deacetylase family protein [Neorhodopirellula lusitana]SMP44254.1 Peptidoglycan/xylan/chitin deacetylase, PgdA/CDA1 family [Neorhodopirellula lusitana]
MNPIRSLALNARYLAQRASRQNRLNELASQNQAPISVLFYHRVADQFPNPWTISTDKFQQHIEYCEENFEMISLAEVQNRLESGCSPRPAVSITFDDGYAENSEFALPYLIEKRIPCTYFVTTEHIRRNLPFHHDVQFGRLLDVNTPAHLKDAIAGGIEIGIHTANHIDFSQVTDIKTLQTEIVDAKADLEDMIDHSVSYFAVPFGMPQQMRPAVFETARQCGIRGVCSAFGAYNQVGNDAFHIRRIHGDPQFARLRNWLSYDERKCLSEPALPLDDILTPAPSAVFAPVSFPSFSSQAIPT